MAHKPEAPTDATDKAPELVVSAPVLIEHRGEAIPQWDPARIVEEANILTGTLNGIMLPEGYDLQDFTRVLRYLFQPTITEKLHFLLGNVERYTRKDEPEEYEAVTRACRAWVKRYNYLRKAFRALLKHADKEGHPLTDSEKESAHRYITPLRVFRTKRLEIIYNRLVEKNDEARS